MRLPTWPSRRLASESSLSAADPRWCAVLPAAFLDPAEFEPRVHNGSANPRRIDTTFDPALSLSHDSPVTNRLGSLNGCFFSALR